MPRPTEIYFQKHQLIHDTLQHHTCAKPMENLRYALEPLPLAEIAGTEVRRIEEKIQLYGPLRNDNFRGRIVFGGGYGKEHVVFVHHPHVPILISTVMRIDELAKMVLRRPPVLGENMVECDVYFNVRWGHTELAVV